MATKSKQLELGNETEEEVAKFFKKNGFWSYITPKKVSGQPVDIIAIKDNVSWLVDAKHLSIKDKSSFPFSRIEANQVDSLTYARNFSGVKNLGFVICLENDYSKFFFLSYDKYLEIEQSGRKSAKISELQDLAELIGGE